MVISSVVLFARVNLREILIDTPTKNMLSGYRSKKRKEEEGFDMIIGVINAQ